MPGVPPLHEPLSPEAIQRIDGLCDEFESGLASGKAPPLEALLDRVEEPARPRLFHHLLELEVRSRQKAGRPLTADEANQRFAGLGPWATEALRGVGLEAAEEALLLEVLEGPVAGQTYRLSGHSSFFVGRGTAVHLPLVGDKTLSRVHFCVEFNPPQARVTDCASKYGTFHNDRKLEPRAPADLRDGDRIRAGDVLIRVRLSDGDPTVTPVPPTLGTTVVHPPGRLPAIPGYVVEQEVGRGGMGVVYKARSGQDGATVAVKTVLPALSPRFDTQARFQREVGILESLAHPNIVRFHETGVAGGLVYFVMEFVEGVCASALVKQSGPLALPRVIDLGSQLLDALAHAHDRGYVHRDVKPGNLLLAGPAGAEVLKLTDFGLARAYQVSVMSGLTVSGQSGGTPEFMPPEQVRDFRAARPAADQYSAAATLYYLATGQHVYERAKSMMDLLVHILQEEPIPLRPGAAVHPAMAGALGAVLRRALARQPESRYPDVRVMRADLQAAR